MTEFYMPEMRPYSPGLDHSLMDYGKDIISRVYSGKIRKNGKEAETHPFAVGTAMFYAANDGWKETMASIGYFHDILEDFGKKKEFLEWLLGAAGESGMFVANAVDKLTNDMEDHSKYMEKKVLSVYPETVKSDLAAGVCKVIDIGLNLMPKEYVCGEYLKGLIPPGTKKPEKEEILENLLMEHNREFILSRFLLAGNFLGIFNNKNGRHNYMESFTDLVNNNRDEFNEMFRSRMVKLIIDSCTENAALAIKEGMEIIYNDPDVYSAINSTGFYLGGKGMLGPDEILGGAVRIMEDEFDGFQVLIDGPPSD